MAIDYYAEADEVMNELDAEGLTVEAESLRNIIAGGSTATEILMGLRWELRQIDDANKVADMTAKRRIRKLIAELDRVLS